VYHTDKDFSNSQGGGIFTAIYYESEINRRSANEDNFCHMEIRINHEAAVSAMVVSDGMGGLSGGKFYSEAAVEIWYEKLLKVLMGNHFKDCSLRQQIETLEEFSRCIPEQINQELYKRGLDAGIKGGTTLSAAIHFWDTWIISNCGDSPVYYTKDGQIFLASEIQNLAEKLVREGKTETGSLLYHQNKNRLLQYLGRRETISPHVVRLSDSQVDSLLMGSDGAFGNLSKENIQDILNAAKAAGTHKNAVYAIQRIRGGG
jgi:serine/threonine protein phosphatase PrpC